jgi:DNA-binding transcriptional LysR family regulator
VLPLVASFQALHPGLTVELSLLDGFADLVAEGFDLAIRGGVLPDSTMVARLLVTVTPLCCAAPGYPRPAWAATVAPGSCGSSLGGHAVEPDPAPVCLGVRRGPAW